MSLPRVIKGCYRSIEITIKRENGDPVDFSGCVDILGIITNSSGVSRDIDGVIAVTDIDGKITWTLGEEDAGTAGRYLVQFLFSFGTYTEKNFPEVFVVEPELPGVIVE